MFRAYFDESGITKEDIFCVVVGYLGPAKEWELFVPEWESVLRSKQFSISAFHAMEFAGRRGEFKGWSDAKCASLIKKLANVIKRRQVLPVGSVVAADLFRQLNVDERKWMTGGHWVNSKQWRAEGAPTKCYFVPFQHCVVQMVKYTPPGEQAYPVFDRQDQFRFTGEKLYHRIRQKIDHQDRLGDEVEFSPKTSAMGLQAADLLAYLSRTFAQRKLKHKDFEYAWLLEKLLNGPQRIRYLDADGYAALLRGYPPNLPKSDLHMSWIKEVRANNALKRVPRLFD